MLTVYDFFNAGSHKPLFTIRAVISHDNDLIRACPHLFLKDNQLLGPCGKDGDDLVARLFQCTDDGQHRCDPHAATGTDDRAKPLDVRRLAEWADDISNVIAFTELTNAGR